jgi:hypothetical protein
MAGGLRRSLDPGSDLALRPDFPRGDRRATSTVTRRGKLSSTRLSPLCACCWIGPWYLPYRVSASHLTNTCSPSHGPRIQVRQLIENFEYPKFSCFSRLGDALVYLILKGEKGSDGASVFPPPVIISSQGARSSPIPSSGNWENSPASPTRESLSLEALTESSLTISSSPTSTRRPQDGSSEPGSPVPFGEMSVLFDLAHFND